MDNHPQALVLDIETVGERFDNLDETTQEMIQHWAQRDARDEKEYAAVLENMKDGLGFSPLTGEVVAIGMYDVARKKSVVYFQAPGEDFGEFEEVGVLYKQKTEKEMLEDFWRGIDRYNELVTFNGRSFDLPFLMIRSAIHKIRPSKDFMSNRYLGSQKFMAKHIDLLEQLSFYGAVRRKGNLHMWCRAFGIESPKEQGVTGHDVKTLFEEKRYKDIARYNVRDIVSTAELYDYWEKYLRF